MNNDIEDLETRIKQARAKDADSPEAIKKAKDTSNARAGMQAGFELVASILICTAAGYWLDKQFETQPLFIILLFFLGVCAGFFSIFRAYNNLGSTVGYSELHKREKSAKTAPKQEE